MRNLPIYTSLLLTLLLCLPAPAGDDKPKDKPKKSFTISKETTFVTKPIDKDGYIDYAAALNDFLSKDVAPKDNAVAALMHVMGPKPEGARLVPKFYERLGAKELPEEGDYLVSLHTFGKERLKLEEKELTALDDAYEALTARPWRAADQPHVAAWLKAMETPLARGGEATRRPKYYLPLIPAEHEGVRSSIITCLVSPVQKCRELASAFAMRAMLRLGEGRVQEAREDVLACHRLGRLITQGGTLIENLVGIAIEHIATEGSLAILEHGKLDAKQIATFRDGWRSIPPMQSLARSLGSAERFMVLEALLMTDQHGPDFLEGLSGAKKNGKKPRSRRMENVAWDLALRNINRWFDRLIAAIERPDRAERHAEMEKINRDIRELKAKTLPRNVLEGFLAVISTPEQHGERIGNILICLLTPALSKVQDASDRTLQVQRNLDIAFALALHRSNHGQFPEKLSELTPKHLEKIPADLFTGKEPVYRRMGDGYLLYSFGLNGADDEGRFLDDEPRGDDLAIRMPRPERRK